ncbi:MAG: DNA alkylation repair protein [Bacteroidota bacterium]
MQATEYAKAMQAYFMPHANPYNAGRMSKYMLNKFEFFGIPSPLRKQLTSAFILKNGVPAPEQLVDIVMATWQLPQRELHYAIMEIASRKPYMADINRIKMFEYMITTNAWWDTVDYIASNLVGALLMRHKQLTIPVTGGFMKSGNIWLQRTALLFQLKFKQNTDQELMFGYIRQLNGSKEFFIRKAIGWALREYSKTNPGAVVEFTKTTELSPLSRREALKVISGKGTV